jgi:hypothetical protein
MAFLRLVLFALLVLGLSCELTAPGPGASTYALHRIGDALLPISLSPPAPYPRLLADTLVLSEDRSRATAVMVEMRTAVEESANQVSRTTLQYSGVLSANLLVVDSCPIGYACVAGLVYAPITYAIERDSLVQQIPPGSSQKPSVYGRIRIR